jgi:hypothetical protein
LSNGLGLCRETAPSDHSLLDFLGLLFRFDPLYSKVLDRRIAVGLLRLCSQASGFVAFVGPHARASATTIDFILPSFLGSWLRSFSFFPDQTCNILA